MATIAGLTPGQTVPWNRIPQGMNLNTPRNYDQGGLQRYDPSAAAVDPRYAGGGPRMGFGGTGVKGGGHERPGFSTGGSTNPNYGRMSGFTPTAMAGQSASGGMSGGGMFGQTPVFSPEVTAQSEYAIRGGADRASNLPFVMKQFDRPGVSRGAGTMASAATQIAATQSQGRENASNQFVDDYMTNQRFLLDAQMARERERLGLGNVEARLAEMIERQQLGATGGLLSMLNS